MQPSINAERVPTWDLQDRLRKALKDAGVTPTEMARYLDVERRTVFGWLRGERPPRTQSLRLWAIKCGVSYEWLTRGESPQQ